MSDKISFQGTILLASGMYVDWHDEYAVVVDQMGLPITHSQLVALLKGVLAHLRHSKLEMEAISRRLMVERHPSMVEQMNFDFFTDGFEEDGFAVMREQMKNKSL